MMSHTSKPEMDAAGLFSVELARTVLNSLSAHIAILDENGVILETNTAWRNFARKGGMPPDHDDRGTNYLEVCEATAGDDVGDAIIHATPTRAPIGTTCGPSVCRAMGPQGWWPATRRLRL